MMQVKITSKEESLLISDSISSGPEKVQVR